MDIEIEELNTHAKHLAEQMGLIKTADTKAQPAPDAKTPPPTSEAEAQKALAAILSVYSLEQITKVVNQQGEAPQQPQQQETPLQQRQPTLEAQKVEEGSSKAPTAVSSHRGPSGQATQRRKPKDIPATSTDQKAAVGRAATGLVREERFKAARASGDHESDDDAEESAAIRLRWEEEMAQQELP